MEDVVKSHSILYMYHLCASMEKMTWAYQIYTNLIDAWVKITRDQFLCS